MKNTQLYFLLGNVSDPHPFLTDPGLAQNLSSQVANEYGSGSRPLYNKVLVILSMKRPTFFHILQYKERHMPLSPKKQGKYEILFKNLRPWVWIQN